MAVIHEQDIPEGRASLTSWKGAASRASSASPFVSPDVPTRTWAMAVRYSLFLLEQLAPGGSVEVRVAPWGAVKVLEGPESDPHNLTPPDVIELEPSVWLRMACGLTSWDEERKAGHISAVSIRDDLSELLPLHWS